MGNHDWCHDCAEGWHYASSLGVALCPLHAAAPALLEALEDMLELFGAPYDPHAPDRVEKARAAIKQAKSDA